MPSALAVAQSIHVQTIMPAAVRGGIVGMGTLGVALAVRMDHATLGLNSPCHHPM